MPVDPSDPRERQKQETSGLIKVKPAPARVRKDVFDMDMDGGLGQLPGVLSEPGDKPYKAQISYSAFLEYFLYHALYFQLLGPFIFFFMSF